MIYSRLEIKGGDMARGKASGIRLDRDDVATVLGMQRRGDRDHDIAAWFGVNQGRIAEAKEGKFGSVEPTSIEDLPPKGPPGLKGRYLRDRIDRVIDVLRAGDQGKATALLVRAASEYDANER